VIGLYKMNDYFLSQTGKLVCFLIFCQLCCHRHQEKHCCGQGM